MRSDKEEIMRQLLAGIFVLGASLSFLAGASQAQSGPPPLVQLFELTPPVPASVDYFGLQVLLSADGRTALVSAPLEDCAAGRDCGAVYVFARSVGGWVLEAKLVASDARAFDTFGSIALSGAGDLALIGVSVADCSAGADCGAVYVFERGPGGWTERQKLVSSEQSAGQRFGVPSLSADGSIALVGAITASCGSVPSCGAVYVFERSAGSFVERQKLSPSDPYPSNWFGGGVTLSGDGRTAWIVGNRGGGGAPGSIYVFTQNGGTWAQDSRIEAPISSLFPFVGPADLSADGRTGIVRGDLFGFPSSFQGMAFIYVRDGAGWRLQAQMPVGSDTGVALSADGNLALVGFPNSPCSGCATAHLLSRQGESWQQIQTLTSPDRADSLLFLTLDLSADGGVALLGLPNADCGAIDSCGTAFVFEPALDSLEVPTVSGLGLALLAVVLAGSGALLLRRSRFLRVR
ncbi:MAG TPA: FG-GAP repeat protein [Thermoanaerobaculia bacterium]|nr:FG-GAP repeat protein [Thermoanaerobaculia bacterium]